MTDRPASPAVAAPSEDNPIETLQSLLLGVPPPLTPLDVSAVDGFICAVLLQPNTVAPEKWLPHVADVEGRPLPAGFDAGALHARVLQRAADVRTALASRQWFDPWIFELDDADATPSESVLPWLAGFVMALELFPALLRVDDDRLLEPLALLYLHFDAADLEDADALLALIETLEPPADLAEAVQDVVRSLMLIADVVQPRPPRPPARRAAARGRRAPRR